MVGKKACLKLKYWSQSCQLLIHLRACYRLQLGSEAVAQPGTLTAKFFEFLLKHHSVLHGQVRWQQISKLLAWKLTLSDADHFSPASHRSAHAITHLTPFEASASMVTCGEVERSFCGWTPLRSMQLCLEAPVQQLYGDAPKKLHITQPHSHRQSKSTCTNVLTA